MGDLTSIVYPDNTAVNYAYDANNNLVSVIDWANRVTSYTYDVNNMLVGVTKPDGSVTATVYDNTGRITSTVEKWLRVQLLRDLNTPMTIFGE